MTMAITTTPVESTLAGLRETLSAALETEDSRYALVAAAAAAEHEETRSRILAMLELLDAPSSATGHPSTNGHAMNGAAPTPPAPVLATDVVIDPRSATVKEFIRAVMGTRPGEIWRAEGVLERMKAIGYTGGSNDESRLGTVRATLGQMVKSGELTRPEAGDFILPARR